MVINKTNIGDCERRRPRRAGRDCERSPTRPLTDVIPRRWWTWANGTASRTGSGECSASFTFRAIAVLALVAPQRPTTPGANQRPPLPALPPRSRRWEFQCESSWTHPPRAIPTPRLARATLPAHQQQQQQQHQHQAAAASATRAQRAARVTWTSSQCPTNAAASRTFFRSLSLSLSLSLSVHVLV